eukprot:gene20006-23972_t
MSVVLRGCTVAADCHFEYGRNKDAIPGVTFLVPYPKTKGKREVDGDHSAGLDDRHVNYNRIIRSVRPIVESPFGLMKRRFAALNGPFGEEEIQLNDYWTCGYNAYCSRTSDLQQETRICTTLLEEGEPCNPQFDQCSHNNYLSCLVNPNDNTTHWCQKAHYVPSGGSSKTINVRSVNFVCNLPKQTYLN